MPVACISYDVKIGDQPKPINRNASPGVRSILNYLYEVKGSGQILSSQHIFLREDYNEVEHIKNLTGKYPAIIEFDLLNFNKSPKHKEQYLRFAKDWYRAGGLVAVSWHETSPELDVLDEGGYKYGTKKRMSQERFNEVLKNGTDLQNKWLEHLDLAAQWLGELQAAGVVVLWRPYHEMTGGWFWWGGKKAESFKSLWIMAYERLTIRHKLNNLIWVWSAAQVGDYDAYLPIEHVDIAGIDMYRKNRNDIKFAHRASKIQQAAKGKPVALTEVGTIPTMDILINHTEFVWFTIWVRGWLDNEYYPEPKQNGPGNSPAWIKEAYAHPKVITRDRIKLR